jgi:hypothetical protein
MGGQLSFLSLGIYPAGHLADRGAGFVVAVGELHIVDRVLHSLYQRTPDLAWVRSWLGVGLQRFDPCKEFKDALIFREART